MTDETENGPRFIRPQILNMNDEEVQAEHEAMDQVAGTDPLEIMATRLFAQQFRNRFRFNHTRGMWMEWTGMRWMYDEKQRARYEMLQLVDRMRRQDPGARRALGKISFADHALSAARVEPHLSVVLSQFDQDPYLLGTPTGYVDLRTGKHHKPDPDKMISKSTAVSPVKKGKPKQWIAFLKWAVSGDQELYHYMQKYLGYCLSGLMNEEIMTFIYGSGGNGKGVMISAVAHIMDDYYVNTPASTFMDTKRQEHSTELARLNGARLVSASETGDEDKWNTARIKEITGNENPISARFMRQDFFEFWPCCKIAVVGNNKPQIGDVDAAIARRLRLIEFLMRPKKEDATLKDQMAEEYGRILQWMIDGFLMYQEEGLKPPERVLKASKAYLASQDVVSEFIDHVLEFREAGRLLRKDIGWALQVYLKENGHAKTVKPPKIYNALEEKHGLSKDDSYQHARAFHGVSITPEFWAVMKSKMGPDDEPLPRDGLRGLGDIDDA